MDNQLLGWRVGCVESPGTYTERDSFLAVFLTNNQTQRLTPLDDLRGTIWIHLGEL